MRKFIVNVNGTSYEVEVEEIGGAPASRIPAPAAAFGARPVYQPAAPVAPVAPAPAAPAAPVAAPAPAPAPAAAVTASAGQESVESPMPGNILDIKVKPGDAVKAGDILLILEAMKMENEILAPRDGSVVAVNVVKGATVNSGDVLCVIG